MLMLIIDNFCIVLFLGVHKLTALYILQHFLREKKNNYNPRFTKVIHIRQLTMYIYTQNIKYKCHEKQPKTKSLYYYLPIIPSLPAECNSLLMQNLMGSHTQSFSIKTSDFSDLDNRSRAPTLRYKTHTKFEPQKCSVFFLCIPHHPHTYKQRDAGGRGMGVVMHRERKRKRERNLTSETKKGRINLRELQLKNFI